MKKIIKIIAIVLVIIFISIQFIRPKKNISAEVASNEITVKYAVPANVHHILKVSCYDCHSNNTFYPGYWNIQPVMWFMNHHVLDGKRHLNFSEFSAYPASKSYKKFKEIKQQVRDGEMPLYSYTLMHQNAALSPDEKLILENWADISARQMESVYPADSLKKK